MDKMIEFVCEQLEELEKKAAKGSMTMPEVQYADTLAHLKKNLLKSEEMMAEMDGEYSGNMGGSYRGGSYRGGSYRGGSYEGGSYARGRGRNARRDSMGRYSSERGYSRDPQEMADQLRDLMEDAPNENVRRDIERLMRTVEQM
ncbi:hypothetical protein J6U76_08675 [bacterium]|nr:hypothetical protein [bacterium]